MTEAREETGLTTLSPHWLLSIEVGKYLDFVKECDVIKEKVKSKYEAIKSKYEALKQKIKINNKAKYFL